MTVSLIDDQLLGAVLREHTPAVLASAELHTTGYWYVRLCQAVLGAQDRPGVLSKPFLDLPEPLRRPALRAVLELPPDIGLTSLRRLGPKIAELRRDHPLNTLGIEVLAAAITLRADVHLSAPSPRLEQALQQEDLVVRIHPPPGRRVTRDP